MGHQQRRDQWRWVWMLVLGGVGMILAGCDSSSPTPTAHFAYVANSMPGSVSGYTIDATSGVLRPIPGSPFPAGGEARAVTVDPTGRFVYVTNAGPLEPLSINVSGYTIDATSGVLTPIPGSPFPAGTFPVSVTVDPTGRFVYVTNAASNNVSGYTIDATSGALTPISGSPFPADGVAVSVMVDPTGRFAYVANASSKNVSGYTIDATSGALTPISGSPFPAGSGPRAVAVDPIGRFVYVTNVGSPGSLHTNVSGYTIDARSGALTPISGSPFPAGTFPVSVTVDPTGRFVYVADNSSKNVLGYTIDATSGALTPISGSPFPAGTFPESVTVDATGRFVYVTNSGSNNVSGYTIDATSGVLTPIPGSPFAAGTAPRSVTTTGTMQFTPILSGSGLH